MFIFINKIKENNKKNDDLRNKTIYLKQKEIRNFKTSIPKKIL